jgi:hypothetical protein
MSSPQKISQLTTAGPLTGAELVPIVQNGGTLQTTVSVLAAFAVVSISPVVSALGTQIAQVSAIASANTVAITSVQADVSALDIRVASVSAVTSVNSAAITSINNVVSTLDVRVSTLEIAVSNIGNVSAIAALVTAVASLEGTVSALTIQVANVSASVSALQIQLNAVSALTSVNAAAITSINNTVSALEIRVSSASTTGVNNTAAITSVNAVVSLKVFRDNDFMTNVQYIDFNTTTSYATSAGRLTWDITHGTLDLGLTGTVNLLIGQRTVAQIYNNSGVTLPKGKAVKVTGASGQRLTGALAQADSDSDSATIFGLMLETVSNLGTGYVATDGVVTNVDTAAYADGDIVYLSPVSAGELTPTKPIAPQHLVQMGYIVKGGSVGAGSIYVKVQNGYELGELHNVKTSAEASIANGEVLAWNTSASVWTNSTALLDTQASVSALNIQVAAVSASVSALQIQIDAVSAALTSTNNVVSALEIRVSAVSAAVVSANAVIAAVSALTSVNAVAIAAVSALVSANTVAIAAVSASVSALQVQVNAVSAAVSAVVVSIGQRVLKDGDTMSGELNMADNLVTRPKFKDYAITAVIRGNVSATATLDMLDGNYFMVTAAGSTTFVFANPPTSAANGGAAGGFILELANGGAATVTWPSATKWPSGTAPTLTSSGTDVFVFITDDGGTVWRGVQSMKDSK